MVWASGRGISIFTRRSPGSLSRSSARTSFTCTSQADGDLDRDPLFVKDTFADPSENEDLVGGRLVAGDANPAQIAPWWKQKATAVALPARSPRSRFATDSPLEGGGI